MERQTHLLMLTFVVCIFCALATALSVVLARDDRPARILIGSGLFLLPCAATYWLSHHLERPSAG